jgi:hypothetical protein
MSYAILKAIKIVYICKKLTVSSYVAKELPINYKYGDFWHHWFTQLVATRPGS